MNLKVFIVLLTSSLNLISASKSSEPAFDAFGMTPLHNAVLSDNYKKIKQLIDGSDGLKLINTPDLASKNTPVHLLVERVAKTTGNDRDTAVDLIKSMVEKGADLKLQSDSGWTPLTKAVYLASDLAEYPTKVIPILLKDCGAVNIPVRKRTALHFAANSRLKNDRSNDLVAKLINSCESSLDFNAVDANDWTPLKVAIAADNMETVEILKSRTSFFSFAMKIGLGIVGFLILAGIGAFIYFKYYRKPENKVEPVTSPKSRSPTSEPARTSSSPSNSIATGSEFVNSPLASISESINSVPNKKSD